MGNKKVVLWTIIIIAIIGILFTFIKKSKSPEENNVNDINSDIKNNNKADILMVLDDNIKDGSLTETFTNEKFKDFSEKDLSELRSRISDNHKEDALDINKYDNLYFHFINGNEQSKDVENPRALLEVYEDMDTIPSNPEESLVQGIIKVEKDTTGYFISLDSIKDYVNKKGVYPIYIEVRYNYNGKEYVSLATVNMFKE